MVGWRGWDKQTFVGCSSGRLQFVVIVLRYVHLCLVHVAVYVCMFLTCTKGVLKYNVSVFLLNELHAVHQGIGTFSRFNLR